MTSPDAPHIADAGAIINLNASGMATAIIRALPYRLQVVDVVLQELEHGRTKGRPDAELLRGLIEQDVVELVNLDAQTEVHFERLVIGPADTTLDDGEAATIAYAVEADGVAVIDDRKAKRICARDFPRVSLRTTVDILATPSVGAQLSETVLADAIFNALQRGRMRVAEDNLDWVKSRMRVSDRYGQWRKRE